MITDMKLSLIENIRARLPGIEQENFHADPPTGQYERPCWYIAYRDKKPSKKRIFGSLLYEYTFDTILEFQEGQESMRALAETLLKEGERLFFWHFVGTIKYLREGFMEIKSYTPQESKKNRERNAMQAEVILTF